MTDTPESGHNNPPAAESFSMAIADLYEEAKNFLDGDAIENQGQADSVTKILDDMKELARDAEKTRKAEKEPFLQAGKEVDARWKAVVDPAKRTINIAEKPLTEWRMKVQAENAAEAKRQRDIADKAAREAQEAHKAATSLDDAEVTEKLLKDARIAQSAANKIDRAPTGLKTYWEAEITDRRLLLAHIMEIHRPTLDEWLDGFASSQVRIQKRNLPGVIAHERKKAR